MLVVGGFAYFQATAPAYACTTQWVAPATSSPAPGATQHLGYPQDDMGRDHVVVGTVVRYIACPPASGNHYNQVPFGPITPKLYGPNEHPAPEGWVHNMEHGALVVLYKCPGDGVACTDAGQSALSQFVQSFPTSPICQLPPGFVGPVVARFDDMAYPYVAMVWDQILPMQTWNAQEVLTFYAQEGDKTNPEKYGTCANPSASPGLTPIPAGS